MRKPFYKRSHRAWYFHDRSGRLVRLGTTKHAAYEEYTRVCDMPVCTVADLVNQFLTWAEANNAPRTYRWYRDHCLSFARFVGPKSRLSDKNLRALFANWRDSLNGGDTHKNGACRAVARVFNWAFKDGVILANPVAGVWRPAAIARDEYLTLEQWAALLAHVRVGGFHDYICFLWETGARPQEARIAQAQHYVSGRLILERFNSKGKKDRRVIRLNDRAREIVERRMAGQGSTGPIFITRYGRGWAARSVQCRFAELADKLGYRVYAYMLRHSFITHALLRGVDPLTVGILVGHKDAGMVMRVYAHVAKDENFLMAKLRQATGITPAIE